jgi:hypothetical protein
MAGPLVPCGFCHRSGGGGGPGYVASLISITYCKTIPHVTADFNDILNALLSLLALHFWRHFIAHNGGEGVEKGFI